nr:retrotransposon protein, putative, unclassified [Tanacetum cinerariifolium]
KSNDGFLVGYAAHSKAYRVYNFSSKKVEETLNLRYLEDKPNVQGLGQEWYFDLDYLTDSLGYTRFNTNPPAGTHDTNILAGTQADDSDFECDEQVILVPSFPSNSFSGPTVQNVSASMKNNLDYTDELARFQRQESEAHFADVKHDTNFRRNLVPASGIVPTGGDPADSSVPAGDVPADSIPVSSVPAGAVLAGSLVSTASAASSIPAAAGIFSSSFYDDFCADVTNLDSTVAVDPVATRRINSIHPQSHILGDLQSPVQTRSTVQKSNFSDSAFTTIDTKWILKNKKDAKGIVVRNKARLVAQGHRKEEGIDYDEVFALVARIEAICLFLAFASYMGFMVYQMDVKSSFLYGEIDEEVYMDDIIFGSINKAWCDEFEALIKGEIQMSVIGELTFFLGLQVKQLPDEIFISQDKYVKDMLKKFDMESVRTATTPYEVPTYKSKDEHDDAVNVYLFRSIIGSLMYLTASRPDIMFAVCACSRHQLEAYSDSDYDGSRGDQNSTTGGCQFLGRRLISWQCKKQTVVATSSTEAEYVAAARGELSLRGGLLLYISCTLTLMQVRADDLDSAGGCTLPAGSYSFLLTLPAGSYSFLLLDWFLLVVVSFSTGSSLFMLMNLFLLVFLVHADEFVSAGGSTLPAVSCGLLLYFVSNVSGYPKLQVVQFLVHADEFVSAGGSTLPAGSYSFLLLNWFLLVV